MFRNIIVGDIRYSPLTDLAADLHLELHPSMMKLIELSDLDENIIKPQWEITP